VKRFFEACKAFFTVLLGKEEVSAPAQEESKDSLVLLHLLQKRGRLIDFLMEDLSSYSDEQIGGVGRTVHEECANCLKDVFAIEPIFSEEEGSPLSLPVGSDLTKIQLSGEGKGELPIRGTLRHKGWRATKHTLPSLVGSGEILAPAEVEV